MESYFELVSREFELRISQIRQFIKKHNPSIGAFNEEILRTFLRDYLPKWVSVGQGFILNRQGDSSPQIDIIIYNSMFYAPLYSVNDLVVLQPESVLLVIEVKTKLNKKILHETIAKNKELKKINPEIESKVFIYNPPATKIVIEYLNDFDFSEYEDNELIDSIYGLSKFCLLKSNITTKEKSGIGYMNGIYKTTSTSKNAVFEAFYYHVYQLVESSINKSLKKGIDNIWIIKNDSTEVRGRLKYSQAMLDKMEFGNIIIEKDFNYPRV
jgi:hypothetical protein